jgi:hypothetical protein
MKIIEQTTQNGVAVSRDHNNAVHGDIPNFVQGMVFVNVAQPSRQSMISLSLENILPTK